MAFQEEEIRRNDQDKVPPKPFDVVETIPDDPAGLRARIWAVRIKLSGILGESGEQEGDFSSPEIPFIENIEPYVKGLEENASRALSILAGAKRIRQKIDSIGNAATEQAAREAEKLQSEIEDRRIRDEGIARINEELDRLSGNGGGNQSAQV